MHNEIIYSGWIKDGELIIDHYSHFKNEIQLQKDCTIEIIVRRKVKKRSLNQNAYYWGVVIPAIQKAIKELGERLNLNETENWLIDFLAATDSEFTHTFLKNKFIERLHVDEYTGEIIEVKPSTRKLNKENFSEYLEKVIQFANEVLEIEIPESTNN